MAEKIVEIPEFITVRELANLLDVSPIDVIKELMNNGIMANINQQIDFETAAIVVGEMGFEARQPVVQMPEVEPDQGTSLMTRLLADEDPTRLQPRPPVVTFLGHVDHGKTSLIDAIRKTRVQVGEVGGITQHIGAYQVVHEGKKITFLDTPGHEAFTAMRARGAQGADIAVLVVAVDDGVMPQTREAISHARAAHVPIVVALNKIDKPNANVERTKQGLVEEGLVPDDWGGETICVPVSAKMNIGIDDLLENILLVSEVSGFKANPNRPSVGVVIEGTMHKSRGPIATLLVQNGTLRQGDSLVVGEIYGRVRAMFDYQGKSIKSAPPSTPVQVLGLSGVPAAGERFQTMEDERSARQVAMARAAQREQQAAAPAPELSLEQLFKRYQAGQTKELNIIIKADVDGSLEPIVNSLEELSAGDIKVHILHKGIGNISESDIMLATASHAIVIGFDVIADVAARRQAEAGGIEIRLYNIIYQIIDDVQKALTGMLEPTFRDVVTGHAAVRTVFRISKVGQIAGCQVLDGVIERNGLVRVLREHKPIFDGKFASLKRFQEDVREVKAGFECGIGLNGFDDFREGDIIEGYKKERVT